MGIIIPAHTMRNNVSVKDLYTGVTGIFNWDGYTTLMPKIQITCFFEVLCGFVSIELTRKSAKTTGEIAKLLCKRSMLCILITMEFFHFDII